MTLTIKMSHLLKNSCLLKPRSPTLKSYMSCISIRSHFKFRGPQMKQQTVVLDKFVHKNHQNILNKILGDKPKIVSKGSANRRDIDSKVNDRRLITRRMSVLNKLLMQSISDILSTEDIGHIFQSLKIRVTQVQVNRSCDSANIYWVTRQESLEDVAKQLDQIKGKLHQHLTERNLMNAIPWLQFVLDMDENYSQEVENILKKCDFGSDFKPSDVTLLETPYEKMSRSDEKPKKNKKDETMRNLNAYEFMKLTKPSDMQINCLGLDYEVLINEVLLNLNKSRALHRKFNAVADPLPPPDWSLPPTAHPVNNESDAVYNTDERIKAMKAFLVENRKKKEKLSRIKKKELALKELQTQSYLEQAFDSYQYNESLFEEELKHNFESSFESSDDPKE